MSSTAANKYPPAEDRPLAVNRRSPDNSRPSEHVAVLMTCFNRRETTRRCLEILSSEIDGLSLDYTLYVTDDGSTDGTADLAKEEFGATVLRGQGLYWAGGMSRAEIASKTAANAPSLTHLLWLNDDVELLPGAMSKFLSHSRRFPGAIIVGAMRSRKLEGEHTTYSGFCRTGRHPLRFELITPSDNFQFVDTFNGNLVLVPIRAANLIGRIDGGFAHALADLDYGLRARAAGIKIVLVPGYVGICERNAAKVSGSLREAYRNLTDRKGTAPPRSTARFMRRHGGNWWMFYFIQTYAIWSARQLVQIITGEMSLRSNMQKRVQSR